MAYTLEREVARKQHRPGQEWFQKLPARACAEGRLRIGSGRYATRPLPACCYTQGKHSCLLQSSSISDRVRIWLHTAFLELRPVLRR